MLSDNLIDKVRILLMENKVSPEITVSIVKLLIADKFISLDDMNNEYAKMLSDIQTILENDEIDDFECVEKIVTVFEDSDMGIDYRHDFG